MTALRRSASILLIVLVAAVSACATAKPPKVAVKNAKIPIRYQVAPDAPAREGTRFRVYRSATPAGPFESLTAEPLELPAAARRGEPVTLYVDRGVELGKTYYYYLEAVDRDGRTSKATEVAPARAILPLQPEDRAP